MKKIILIVLTFMLWVSTAGVMQAAADAQPPEEHGANFEGRVGAGYRGITQEGGPVAGEYDFIRSSPTGALDMEWDPLPHRFVLESYYLNHKDFFGEMDYAYKDIVVFNAYARDMYHNLNHYTFGPAPTTPGVMFTDRDPEARNGIENEFSRAFVRFKTPDFPFHLFAEVVKVDRQGSIQQRFLREFEGTSKVSDSRHIDWNTQQVRVGLNSHLGPIEAEYSHLEKKFDAKGDTVLYDVYPPISTTPVPHNLVPDVTSSSDTIKLHTSYSGRLVLSGTYSGGKRKNEDSKAKVKFWNSAGDITFMPLTSLVLAVKYRHYDIDPIDSSDLPTTRLVTPTSTTVFSTVSAIRSKRDTTTGTIRYRATDRMTIKGEYIADLVHRINFFDTVVPERTTKGTAKIGITYRVMSKIMLRADYNQTKINNPAYDTDPDKSKKGTATITWAPTPRFNTLLSYSAVRETRDLLGVPLGGGSRDAERDQGLASVTVMAGNRSSITMSYAYFKNKVEQTITLQDTAGAFALDRGVPYDDIAHVGSLALTVAPVEGVNLTASGSRSYSRGNFILGGAGTVTNTDGIAELSDIKVIDSVYAAGIEMEHGRNISSELRYQYRDYDDRIDNTQDGTVRTILATLSMKW